MNARQILFPIYVGWGACFDIDDTDVCVETQRAHQRTMDMAVKWLCEVGVLSVKEARALEGRDYDGWQEYFNGMCRRY